MTDRYQDHYCARLQTYEACVDFMQMFDDERVDPETERELIRAITALQDAKAALRAPRNEREVRTRPEPTAPFHVGQSLEVVMVGRNTITVSFFDGRTETVTRHLEVLDNFNQDAMGNPICDQYTDAPEEVVDAIDILAEGEWEDELLEDPELGGKYADFLERDPTK